MKNKTQLLVTSSKPSWNSFGAIRFLSSRLLNLLVAAAITITFTAAGQLEPLLAQPPSGFADELVTSLAGPTALTFTPDGRLLITQQTGQLRVFQNGALLSTPAIDLFDPNQDGDTSDSLICNDTERGLLGVVLDPNFAANHYIYLYYTFDHAGINVEGSCPRRGSNPDNPRNQVARFVLPDTNVIDVASRTVLLSNIESNSGNHNAGDLHFGADGYLYISSGDGGIPPDLSTPVNSQLTTNLNGKILRIQTDGNFPASNPYASDSNVRHCGESAGMPAGSGPCGEIFAKGLRNPFRFAIKPGTNLIHINDVGQNQWEEINLGASGADYGWRLREGPCPYPPLGGSGCGDEPYTAPVHTYNHSSGCASITGAAFVPSGIWPTTYNNAYLFADYVCAKIFRLAESSPYTTPQGGTYQFNYVNEELFSVPNNLAPVSMVFGTTQSTKALYYAACPKDNNCSSGGQIRRIRYTGGVNSAPTAQIQADVTAGALPLTVNFSGANSSDPDSDPLTYDWDFGDGSTSNGNSSATIQHTYNSVGNYTVTLIVRDNQGNASDPVTLTIEAGNTPPSPTIVSPTQSKLFYVGETITLVGSATDKEDGTLADNKLSWQVIQHHVDAINPNNVHTHPWMSLTTGNNLTFTTPDMEDSYAYNSYLEIILKATDSVGASKTITQSLLPRKVELTVQTQPSDLVIKIGQISSLSPRQVTVWDHSNVTIEAVTPQTKAGKEYEFVSWSDGGLSKHALVAPSSDTTFLATFAEVGTAPTQTPSPTDVSTPTSIATPTGGATPTGSATTNPTATPVVTPVPTATDVITESKVYLPVIQR